MPERRGQERNAGDKEIIGLIETVADRGRETEEIIREGDKQLVADSFF